MTDRNLALAAVRLNRRRFLALASGATVTAILAACGGSSTPTSPAVNDNAPGTVNPAQTRAAAAATTSASSAVVATTSGGAQKVSVMLDWVPNTNHTGLYVAQERGYFTAQGLNVEILPLAEGSSVEQIVGNGKVQFGISSSEPLAKARSEGIPIVSIAPIIQHNTSGFASLNKANIARPKDFEGKRYASFGSPTEKALIGKLMQTDGGDVSKVEFVETGDSDFLTLASKGQVDFAWVFEGWEVIDGKLRGLDLNYLPLTAYTQVIPDYYTPIFITNDAMTQKNGDVVKKFLAATSKGYTDAIADPKATGDILAKATPETNTALIQQSQAYLAKQYKADAPQWGAQKAQVWQAFGAFMTEQKLLAKPFDPTTAFTTAFLP
ncbi:MAG: ABC transporter substrate-binding protein [Thermomicrobiales bacterium]